MNSPTKKLYYHRFFFQCFAVISFICALEIESDSLCADAYTLHSVGVIEFLCVITVSTLAVWLARENIKRLIPIPCINVEYSHGVVYMEYTT